jgi:uncharacterized protein YkwD
MTRMTSLTIILVLVNCNPPGRLTIPPDSQVIFRNVNSLRIQHGLPPLRYLHAKQVEVDAWAERLERNYGHARSGYTCENIAYNSHGSEKVFDQWLNSPPHRRNMLLRRIRYCTIPVHVGSRKGIHRTYYAVFRGYESQPRSGR